MSTYNQLIKRPKRPQRKKKSNRPALLGAPQKTAALVKIESKLNKVTGKIHPAKPAVREVTPRKPNSGKRKVARIRIKQVIRGHWTFEARMNLTYTRAFAYLPGEGSKMKSEGFKKDKVQDLKELVYCWIRGGRTKDVPGSKYKLMHLPEYRNRKKGRIQRRKKKIKFPTRKDQKRSFPKQKRRRTRDEKYALGPLVVLKKKRSKYANKYRREFDSYGTPNFCNSRNKDIRDKDRIIEGLPVKKWKYRFHFY